MAKCRFATDRDTLFLAFGLDADTNTAARISLEEAHYCLRPIMILISFFACFVTASNYIATAIHANTSQPQFLMLADRRIIFLTVSYLLQILFID